MYSIWDFLLDNVGLGNMDGHFHVFLDSIWDMTGDLVWLWNSNFHWITNKQTILIEIMSQRAPVLLACYASTYLDKECVAQLDRECAFQLDRVLGLP